MTGCLYEVLGLSKEASQEDIKKAYRQRALQLHPDKNPGNEDAKAKFQLLQKVYAVLGEEEKRKIYDETGSTDDDDLAGAGFDGLVDYFRAMFGIKTEDIEDFTARYQDSADERADLLRYYNQFRGRMEAVFDHLMCSDPMFDSHRLRDILEEAIQAGEVQRFKPYTAWAKSVAGRPRPPARSRSAGEAGVSNALIAAIQSKRAAAANNFFDSLAAKYGSAGARDKSKGKEKAKGSNAAPGAIQAIAEPTDSEFEAARQRLEDRHAFRGSDASSKAKGRGSEGTDKAAKIGRRSHGGSDIDELEVLEKKEDAGASDSDAEEEHQEDRQPLSGKRPAKKARRSDAGRVSAATEGDLPASGQRKPAMNQKRKNGAKAGPSVNGGSQDGEGTEGVSGGSRNSGKRPLKAAHAPGREAGTAPEGRDANVKSSKAKDKKDKVGPDAGVRRGAEKENNGATLDTARKDIREDRRLSGGGSKGRSDEGHPSKKSKRVAA